jgi:hypothetical protein
VGDHRGGRGDAGEKAVDVTPNFRQMATAWVDEYRRKSAGIVDADIPRWVDYVEFKMKEAWAAERLSRVVDRQLSGFLGSLDETLGRIVSSVEQVGR